MEGVTVWWLVFQDERAVGWAVADPENTPPERLFALEKIYQTWLRTKHGT